MALYLPSSQVRISPGLTCQVLFPFQPPFSCPVLHLHPHPHLPSRRYSGYFAQNRVFCVEAGLKGGGAGGSKPPSKASVQKTLEEESDEWLRLMAAGLKQLDAEKVNSATAALLANPRGRDIRLLELAIPALAQAKAFSRPGNRQWTDARLQLAQLLRISTVRLAIRRQALEQPLLGRLLTGLKSAVQQAEALETLAIDLEAELSCSRTVLKSLNSPFWSELQTTLPNLADFRNSSDPASVLQPLFPLFSPANPSQTRILASVLMLTIMRHARKYLSTAAIAQLQELAAQTQAWALAVLLNRLIGECLEEQELPQDVSTQLRTILTQELMVLKDRNRPKGWKVRKSAIRIARKVAEIGKEKDDIEQSLQNRAVLEGDEMVRTELPELKQGKELKASESERELRCGCSLIKRFYATIHDRGKVNKVAVEMEHLAQSIDHLVALGPDLTEIAGLVGEAKVKIWRIRRIVGKKADIVRDIFGRDSIKAEILALLRSKPAKIAILGAAGMGKTALIEALRPALEREFAQIYWVRSLNSLTLTQSLLGPSPLTDLAGRRAAVRGNPSHLLIYDGADFQGAVPTEIDPLIASLYDLHEAAVVVTSRNEDWSHYLPYSFHLSPYSARDAVSRLAAVSGLGEERLSSDLVAALEGNPAAVELAGRYLRLSEGFEPLEKLLVGGSQPVARLSALFLKDLTAAAQLLASALAYFDPDSIPMDLVTEVGNGLQIANIGSVLKELEAADFLTVTASGLSLNTAFSSIPTDASIEPILLNSLVSRLSTGSLDSLVHIRHYSARAKLCSEALSQALLHYCLSHGLGTEAAIIARTAPASKATSSDSQVDFLFSRIAVSQQAGNWIDVQIASLQAYNLLKAQRSVTLFHVLVELAKVSSRLGEAARAAKWVEEAADLMSEIDLKTEEKLELCRLGAELLRGRSDRAVGLLRLGIELASKAALKPEMELWEQRLDLAEALIYQNKHEEGLLAILEFLRRANPASNSTAIAKAFLLLSTLKCPIQPERRAEILAKELELRRNAMDRNRLILILSEMSHFQPSRNLSQFKGLDLSGAVTADLTLALFTPRSMQLFDCLKLQFLPIIKLAAALKVDHLSAYTVLKDLSVFVCGGGEERALFDTTFRVFASGQVERLGNMVRPRQAHGLAEWSGSMYAFGGETLGNEPFAYSESLEIEPLDCLSTQQWVRIPNMLTARSCFSPCIFEDWVYLIGGNTSKAERFDPQLQRYEPLPIQLADSEDTCTVLTSDSEILTFSPHFCYHYTPSSGLFTTPRSRSSASTHSTSPRQLLISAGNMRGAAVDSWVYISVHDHIRAVDLRSNTEVVLLL